MQNTLSSGGQPSITNYTDPTSGTINLNQNPSCTATSSAIPSFVSNSSAIQNVIDVSSITGTHPDVSAQTTTTNNVSSMVNVFNMANTTLNGSCWHFQVLNFFASHTGDLILPQYQDIVNPTVSSMKPASINIQPVQNTAHITNALSAMADTGSSTASNVTTGNAAASISTQNILNTTLSGNNWLLLTIHSFGGWDGTLLNWPGDVLVTPNETIAYIPLQQSNAATSFIRNNATVTNTIKAYASSGMASPSGNLITGSAQALIRLFNLINTTISGNNWYYSYITIFDTFHGNIMFPAPTPTSTPEPKTQTVSQNNLPLVTPTPISVSMPIVTIITPTPTPYRYNVATVSQPDISIVVTPVIKKAQPQEKPGNNGNPILFAASTTVMATSVEIFHVLRGRLTSRRNRPEDFS